MIKKNMENEILKKVEEYAKSIKFPENSHNFEHADRVRNWALQIASEEGFADLLEVEIAALLHDIGTSLDRKRHGEVGAEMAEKFLTENNLLPNDKIAEVCQAIKFHNKNRGGEGKLLDILRDADMLDLFGAIGIMRTCVLHPLMKHFDPANVKGETWQMTAKDFDQRFDSGRGTGDYIIDDLNFQISCSDNLSTETAKRLAKPMIEYTKNFLLELEKEIIAGQNQSG
jgi:uncharacterized protein